MNKFESLDISIETLRAIQDMGFTEMSPIQREAIPILLDGEDIIGQAQTGTGKTVAFSIPIIEKVNSKNKNLQALVLCPTRELSIQVAGEIKNLCKYKDLKVTAIYGGEPINKQIKDLKKGTQIVVGTPGRVMDHMRRKTMKLDMVDTIVLDEADEMFDMGFRDDISFVISKIENKRQTIFFSATMPEEIIRFAKKYQSKPKMVKIKAEKLTVSNVKEYYYEVKQSDKTDGIMKLLKFHEPKLSVVFCNTKRQVDKLVGDLIENGYKADGLHGDLKQTQRDRVMDKFRKGKIDILVATDVAARGIDVDDVDAVFNYDLPENLEYYVHRIGRTARAGREGVAYNLVSKRDRQKIKRIEKYTKTNIKKKKFPSESELKKVEVNNIKDTLDNIIENKDIDDYVKMVYSLEDGGYDLYDLSASLLKMLMENENNTSKDEVFETVTGEISRVYISIGKKMKVNPGNILAGIIEHTDLEKDSVGKIDIYDTFSFVEIPRNKSDKFIKDLSGKQIGGRRVRAEMSKARA